MPLGVELRLYDDAGSAQASLTGIQACWWDVEELFDINSTPIGKSNAVTTDVDGDITLDLSNVSGLTAGDYGYLVLYKLDGSDYRDSLIFAGKVQTSTITSGVDMYYYDSGWTRPASWLTMTAPGTSDQKFVGLHAVYEENANFVALSAEGAYVINWGDGTGDQNIATGVTAETNISWANAANTSDVGIADAVSCTFTDSGDTVGITGHDFKNGEKVAFSTITSTTGISTYTTYWVRDAAADTFKVAATQGGSALTLTTDGSGNAYRPKYRQVIVTLTMQGGNNLTKLNLHVKHSQSGLGLYTSGFHDIALAGQYLTDLRLGAQTPGSVTQVIRFMRLEQVNIVRSNLKQCTHLLYGVPGLKSIVDIATSTDAASTSAVTFQDTGDTVTHVAHGRIVGESVIFRSITSTIGITVGIRYFIISVTTDTYKLSTSYGGSSVTLTNNGSGTAVYGTDFSNLFNANEALTTIPMFDTAAGVNFSYMFNSCHGLTNVPRLDTSAGVSLASMFSSCHGLTSVPLFSTSTVADFGYMFAYCYALTVAPLLDTSAGTSFSYMFTDCYCLEAIPSLDTSAGTNFSSMCRSCTIITTAPPFNTSAGTNFGSMFNGCVSLTTVPLLNTSAGTSFSSMFNNCPSLVVGALSGTRYAISYAGCKLPSAELNRIYSNLGTPNGGAQTITVSTNWGTSGDNPALVPSGWTVSGS